jgi:hypothetical protein
MTIRNFGVVRGLWGGLVLFAVACSGGGSKANQSTAGAGGNVGSGGAAGATSGAGGESVTAGAGGVDTGQPFVPAGIDVQYVASGPSGGLEIIAYTLLQQAGSLEAPAWIVAVQNNGTDPICIVDVPADFLDASGATLASTPGTGALAAPMYETFGSPSPCLGPGDIGMGTITLGLSTLDITQVARIEHGFIGNIDPAAVRLTGVSVQNVQTEVAFGTALRFTGTVSNDSTSSIADPDVHLFVVDPAGRPYVELDYIELVTIPVGSTWDFQTVSYDGSINDWVSYVQYDWP